MGTVVVKNLTAGVPITVSIDGGADETRTPYGPPLAIAPGNISIANPEDGTGLEVTITTLPDNQGSAITDLEYEVDNSGTWVSWGSATTGTYLVPIAALTLDTEADIQVRARNASATPGAELATPLTETPTNAGPVDLLGGEGAFDAVGSWTGATGSPAWTIAGGVASINGATNAELVFPLAGLIPGATYSVTFTVLNRTSGSFRPVLLNDGPGDVTMTTVSANGTFTATGVAPSNPDAFALKGVSTPVFEVDNVTFEYVSGP